jgi:hypothetical protein
MKLKLLAPFLSPAFSLRTALVAQEPRQYEAAWSAVANLYGTKPFRPAAPFDGAVQVRFEHTGNNHQNRSRYRTIASHSLTRPLSVIELRVNLRGDAVVRLLHEAFAGHRCPPLQPLIDWIARTLEAGERTALVRVYDHRVSTLQLDLDVGASPVDAGNLPHVLDGLQDGMILFAEKLVELLYGELLTPMFDWLRDDSDVGRRFLDVDASAQELTAFLETTAQQNCRTLWVTRSLILESKDGLAPDSDAARTFRRTLVGHWLKDVRDGTGDPDTHELAENATMESTRWLNYLFAEEAYRSDYPEQGFLLDDDGSAAPFSATWNAMEIAQYYYAAFDVVQTSVSHILAVSLSRTGERKVNDIQRLLDLAIRDVQMLRVEFYESQKYLSRRVEKKLNEILDYWGFDELLSKRTDQRLEACVERLAELHARAAERSTMLTDLVLLSIGVTSLFGIGLALAEYGRAHTLDPALVPYEGVSFNVAQWIAAHSTDRILLASLVMSLALIVIYAFFRTLKSKS